MDEVTHIKLTGGDYVILPRTEYDRLTGLAKAAKLPDLPAPDADGNYPAVEYARAALARKLIRERVEAGLSQRALAKLAGVRFETICRIETGKHTPHIPTMGKLESALKRAARTAGNAKRKAR
jgi:DNA-binding XRE family transcriptional regulator